MSKHWTEVARINGGIVTISPFRVDIPSSSQRVRFGGQSPRMEMDNKIELGKVFRPTGLSSGKDLGCGEVLKVLMIHDHIDRSTRTFEVVSPDMESIEDHQQFFLVSVIVEFWRTESAGMEGHGVDYTGIGLDGEDGTKGIVQGVSLNNDRISVAAAPSWHFAILVNKFCKIMKLFEQLDHLRSWWVLCQH